MLLSRRKLLVKALKAASFVAWGSSLFVAFAVEVYGFRSEAFLNALAIRVIMLNVLWVALFGLFWHGMCRLFGLFKWQPESGRLQLARSFAVASAATAVLAAAGPPLGLEAVTYNFLGVFFLAGWGLLFALRLIVRSYLALVWNTEGNLRHVLVVGTDSRAARFVENLLSDKQFGYKVTGFVADGPKVHEAPAVTGVPVVTDVAGLPEYLREHVVDEVAVFLPLVPCYRQVNEILGVCENHGLVVRVFPASFPGGAQAESVSRVGDESVFTMRYRPKGAVESIAKRGMDICFSFFALLLLAPFLLAVCALVKFSSPGPVFFVQERIGFNKRRFNMYKFRTMITGAEKLQDQLEEQNEASGAAFKIAKDPRVTRVGRVLRRLSIDELPQLLNVLKGDMSLVGPRPLPLRDYKRFTEEWHRRRFSVRPGLTCFWQVNGRGRVDFSHWMWLDMQYIDSWSLWLDLKLIAKTIPAVFRMSGAV